MKLLILYYTIAYSVVKMYGCFTALIALVGKERADLSAINFSLFCGNFSTGFFCLLVLGIGCII